MFMCACSVLMRIALHHYACGDCVYQPAYLDFVSLVSYLSSSPNIKPSQLGLSIISPCLSCSCLGFTAPSAHMGQGLLVLSLWCLTVNPPSTRFWLYYASGCCSLIRGDTGLFCDYHGELLLFAGYAVNRLFCTGWKLQSKDCCCPDLILFCFFQ